MPLTLDRFARQLDWNLLRTFLVIAEERNLTRAAQRLFLCQPTISGALRRLEERLGCRLIARGAGHFELTEAGRELHALCLEIHRSVSAIGELKLNARQELSGTVRIRTISGVSCEPLDGAIAEFSRGNPTAQFEVHVGHSRDNVAAVIKEVAPIGLSLFRQEAPDVEYRLLWREPFDLYCGAAHALAGRKVDSLQALREASWVEFACERDSARMHPLAVLKREHGIGQRVVAIAESAEELRLLLRRGIGVGYLPRHIAEPDIRDGRLRRVSSPLPDPTVDVYMATNLRMNVSPVEAAFRAMLASRLDAGTDRAPPRPRRGASRPSRSGAAALDSTAA
jgi:DNA-binding transcriptional LysR family regulator